MFSKRIWAWGLLLAACGSPSQGNSGIIDSGSASDVQGDVTAAFDGLPGDTTELGDTVSGDDSYVKGDFVWLTFAIDDSANQTFTDGDMQWTGSFTFDEATNSITYATSWLPTDGPFVALYDDGPQPTGHEKAGATAGDHIFTNQVKFVATQATKFEYGALNEFNNWMWAGPNGTFTIQPGQGGTYDVPGMKLPKFGTVDAKITLDTKALNKAYAAWNTNDYKFYVKGTLNQWTPVQLLDDGQKGDAAAGDGILTYVLKQNLGKHDGPLNPGDEVQFTFVTTQGDADPADGQEYKQGGNGLPDGVLAWTASEIDATWQSAPVVMSKDSKGKTLNTAFVVPGGKPIITCDPPCTGTDQCINGLCKSTDVDAGTTDVDDVATTDISEPSDTTVTPTATLTGISPTWAKAKGGTTLTLQGMGLTAQDAVKLVPVTDATLGALCSNVAAVSGGLTCTTPPLPPVFADVTVNGTLKLPAALDVVPVDTPVIDGLLDADWHAMSLAALNDTLSNWDDPVDLSKTNELNQLWLAYDATNLYIGVKGNAEPLNAIACYLDVDFGSGTGVGSPSGISDASGAVDNALGNLYTVGDNQIGIDFAFATVGMASFAGGDLAGSTKAGWRGMAKPDDLAWLQGIVQASSSNAAVEASISLAQLYPNGIPASGAALKVACVLVNGDGSAASNQILPTQLNQVSPTTIATWWTLHVYPVAP